MAGLLDGVNVRELIRPTGTEAPLNRGAEVGVLDRLGMSFKATDPGRANYLKARGWEVVSDNDGTLYARDPAKNEWVPVDSPQFNALDIVDVTGPVLTGAATLPFKATIPGQATGGLMSEVLTQGISKMLPGEDNLSNLERASRLGTSTAIGGLAQGGINLGVKGFNAARQLTPQRLLGKSFVQREGQPFAQESAALEELTGVDFTPGQRTGHSLLSMVEGYLRRSPLSADKWIKHDAEQAQRSVNFLNNTLDSIVARAARVPVANAGQVGGSSTMEIGNSLTNAFGKAVDDAVNLRSSIGRKQFGAVTEEMGNQRSLNAMPFIDTIDDLIRQYDVPGAGDASSALVRQLQTAKRDIMASAERDEAGEIISVMMTPQHLQRLMSIYSKASAGKGDVFKDLGSAQQRQIARQAMSGLEQVLDDSVEMGIGGESLRVARDTWRMNSQAINDLEKSVLGKLIGGDMSEIVPEKIAQGLMRLEPSQLKLAAEQIGKIAPKELPLFKRMFFEEAMYRAGMPRSNAAARVFDQAEGAGGSAVTPEISIPKLLTELKKSGVWEMLDTQEQEAMRLVTQSMLRLANKGGMQGSPTQPLQEVAGLASSIGNVKDLVLSQIPKILGARKLTDLLLTPDGRRALYALGTTMPESKPFKQAYTFILGKATADEMSRETTPQEKGLPRQPRNLLD